MRVSVAAAFVIVALACAWTQAQAGSIDPALAARLNRPAALAQRPVAVIVELEGKPDLAALAASLAARPARERPGALAASLRAAFDRAAPGVRAALERAGALQIEPLWLNHAFAAQLPPQSVAQIAAAPGVARVYADMQLKAPVRAAVTSPRALLKRQREETKATQPAAPAAPVDPVAWRGELPAHLSALGVASYWQRGVTGKGVVVAVVDSGVDARETPLMASFRGNRADWFDPFGQHARPFDASGHGTHVAYVIAGRSGVDGGAPVGVAPHAQWIAARIYDDNGLGSVSAVHRVYQWLLDPDASPETADAPHIVNNSWGLPQTIGRCEMEFARDFAALRAAGIHVVFAAGNEGPEPNTSMSPANNPGVLAVGALTAEGKVADQSGRGPSACGGGAYPHVLAPGVEIESVDAAGRVLGEPLRVTGTSFAAALASGMLALIASESPAAAVDERERRLAAALASSDPALAQKSPTAVAWHPELGAGGRFEIDSRSLLAVLPWTAKLARIEIEDKPARGSLQTLAADRLRYVADGDEKPAAFTIVAHTADGRRWRVAVEPQPAPPAQAVALRRLSVATRPAEPLHLSRAQLAGDTAFDSIRASQTIRGGRVEIGDDGSVRYTPRPGFRGVDQFVCTLLAADGSARERVQVAVMVR
ncbi:MAG: S8 family serine peptidase [Pseudomonadota bacterium]